jgi:hypothetical protein
MAILKRVGLGRALTHPEMDENFSSVYFSSSLENNANTLRLYYDTDPVTYNEIPLNAGSSIGIINYADNRVLTATPSPNIIQGESNFTYDGITVAIGRGKISLADKSSNVLIGRDSGLSIFNSGQNNTTLGIGVAGNGSGDLNTLVGYAALGNGVTINSNVAVGASTLLNLGTGTSNVAVGTGAGSNLQIGDRNIYIGTEAGPAGPTSENDKLYINNSAGSPLIGGDFAAQTVTISGSLLVSQSVIAQSFTGSYQGDGSGLTGIPSTGWDGIRNGNARITGSLTVSGSTGTIVNFTGVSAISGSIFSGSFVGNGSGLTGVVADWNGRRNGNAEITGSFTVSGSSPTIRLRGETIIDNNIKIWNPSTTSIGIGFKTFLANAGNQNSVALGYNAAVNSIQNNVTAIGYSAGYEAGLYSVFIGDSAGLGQTGQSNTVIGSQAMTSAGTGVSNTIIGASAAIAMNAVNSSVVVGANTLAALSDGNANTVVGTSALSRVGRGSSNTVLGANAGENILRGTGNVYIGNAAGPSSSTTSQNNKLYINNAAGNPLIGGDFAAKTVTVSGSLFVSQSVTAQSFTGSFNGNGANLTNLPATDWNGVRNGNAQITGSLVVSGSGAVINFTNTIAISGSTFSGSFVGNGSGLTGINVGAWDGTRSGSAAITGSLVISGSLLVTDVFTITSGSVSSQPGVNIIHIATSSLSAASTTLYRFPLDASTGYTGFKADYTLTNSSETSKKVGTLLGSWDRIGNPIINDSYTLAIGDVTATAFSIASNSTSASLNLGVTAGSFELNMLITAFKRSI